MADRPSVPDKEREVWDAREIARRNRAAGNLPLSPVMQTAVTARELAHAADSEER